MFEYRALNDIGINKCNIITAQFEAILGSLKQVCPNPSREFSLVVTKLEEACFFAKKSVSIHSSNWKVEHINQESAQPYQAHVTLQGNHLATQEYYNRSIANDPSRAPRDQQPESD